MRQSLAKVVAARVRAEMGWQDRRNGWLAAQLQVSEMWVSRRLRGHIEISLSDLEKIAAALGVPVDRFLPESERVA